MILVLGDPKDEHAAHIAHELETRNADVEFLASDDFPEKIQARWRPDRSGEIVLACGRPCSTAEIQSVYWRNYGGYSSPNLPHAGQQHIALNDSRSLFESMLWDLPVRWVNGLAGFEMHQTKPRAFARVAALGVLVPDTIWTNDPDAVRRFAADRECIFKPVQGGAHTEPLTAEHLSDEHLQNLKYAPITLQQMVSGVDIRVFVVGDDVFACEIQTDQLDFRNDAAPEITAIDLPAAIADQSHAIAAGLHLCWAGIDFRRDAEGAWWFFEANPSSMFLGFEQRTGLPISDALCSLLMKQR